MTLRKSSLFILVTYIIAFFGPLLFSGISPNAAINVTTALYIIGALVMIGIFLKTTEPSPLEETATLKSPIFIFLLGVSGIFIAMLIQGVTFAIEVAITGEQATSQNTQAIVAVILANPLFILATTIGGPIMEEFVFRYAFIHLIQPFTNFWIAATVSSAIFSLAHADGHFFVYFFMGSYLPLDKPEYRQQCVPQYLHSHQMRNLHEYCCFDGICTLIKHFLNYQPRLMRHWLTHLHSMFLQKSSLSFQHHSRTHVYLIHQNMKSHDE